MVGRPVLISTRSLFEIAACEFPAKEESISAIAAVESHEGLVNVVLYVPKLLGAVVAGPTTVTVGAELVAATGRAGIEVGITPNVAIEDTAGAEKVANCIIKT